MLVQDAKFTAPTMIRAFDTDDGCEHLPSRVVVKYDHVDVTAYPDFILAALYGAFLF